MSGGIATAQAYPTPSQMGYCGTVLDSQYGNKVYAAIQNNYDPYYSIKRVQYRYKIDPSSTYTTFDDTAGVYDNGPVPFPFGTFGNVPTGSVIHFQYRYVFNGTTTPLSVPNGATSPYSSDNQRYVSQNEWFPSAVCD